MLRQVRIGDLDRKITIQSVSETLDSETNHSVLTYSTLATVWAKRLKVQSNESYEAKQQVAVNVVRYLIRYRTGITERMRIVDNGSTYEISGIEEIDRKNTLILTAEKRDNG